MICLNYLKMKNYLYWKKIKDKDSILNDYYTTMFLYNIKFISYTNYIKSIKI